MSYKENWLDEQTLRASTVLTGSYVASDKQEIKNKNQLLLYVSFTIGSLTYAEIKVEFSADGTNWYQETSQVSAGSGLFTQNPVVRKFTASGNKRIPIPVTDRYVRVQCKGTGTVTNSLMEGVLELGSH